MSSQHNLSARRIPAPPFAYLLVAVAATAANLALWAVGVQYTIATGMLVGTACAGVVCWRQAVTEERMTRRLDQLNEEAQARRLAYLPTPRLDEDALREYVERAVAEELGKRESVHAQGYAEGYVDGIDRRGKDPSAN